MTVSVLASVRDILQVEAAAVQAMAVDADAQRVALEAACDLILTRCGGGKRGRLVVSGMGKAGKIADKLAATFASTGTPAFFLHPAEARHGDLGMIDAEDVVLAFSNSGSSEELVALLPSLKRVGVPVIVVVGNLASPMARHADVALSIGKVTEACPLGLAPSTSTTCLLALGDALALTVQRQRAFTPEQYARFHPGGALGRKLMTCAEAMRTGHQVATISPEASVAAGLRAITQARAGSVMLVDGDRRLLGIFTDGDFRRRISQASDPGAVLAAPLSSHASMPCQSVRAGELLTAALHRCHERRINELPVVDDAGRVVGLLDLQDLVDRGFEV